MRKKITSRDLLFFALGLITMTIIVIIWDWESFQAGLQAGWNK